MDTHLCDYCRTVEINKVAGGKRVAVGFGEKFVTLMRNKIIALAIRPYIAAD